jgi:putative tryptophan/tyrosine transport system substrate-binding protein
VIDMMDRRTFAAGAVLLAVAGFAGAPASAQPADRPSRLAFVANTTPLDRLQETGDMQSQAFFGELRRLGWVDGRNLQVERWRFATRPESEWDILARDIVATQPDVIYVSFSTGAARFRAATAEIPVVYTGSDPAMSGFGENLARPADNLTGFSVDGGPGFHAKAVQLLRDAVPHVRRLSYLTIERNRSVDARRYADVEQALGVTLFPTVVGNPLDRQSLTSSIAAAKQAGAEALVVGPTAEFNNVNVVAMLAEYALEQRLPAISTNTVYARAGLLMTYDSDRIGVARAAAGYVDRILRGAKPADLPYQMPMRFDLIVNLKTAKALGLTIPDQVLVFATEVIE